MTFGVYLSARFTRAFFLKKHHLEGATFCRRRLIRLMGGGENNVGNLKAVDQYLHDA